MSGAGSEVAQLAHRLAGSAANLGATSLRQILQDLEYAGRKPDWPAADRFPGRGEPRVECCAGRSAVRPGGSPLTSRLMQSP